jgi:hypothetical protein
MLVLFGINLALGYLVFFGLDRGLLVRGSYRPPEVPDRLSAGPAVRPEEAR